MPTCAAERRAPGFSPASSRFGDDGRAGDRRPQGKIDKLGPVNMMAIEQFTELDAGISS